MIIHEKRKSSRGLRFHRLIIDGIRGKWFRADQAATVMTTDDNFYAAAPIFMTELPGIFRYTPVYATEVKETEIGETLTDEDLGLDGL